MNTSDYNNPKLLDNIIQYLNSPDIEEGKKSTFTQGLLNFGSKLFTNITRVKNKVFNDGIWYDESKACQTLLDYINNPKCKKALNPQHQKIMLIYDRLTHLSREKGTWTDGIDKELLLANEPESKEDKDLHLLQLKKMILDEVFIPDSPEEQIFEKQETSQKKIFADPRGQSYIFTRQKGLNPPSNCMLFHIQADEFGSSSELEGGKSTETVHYLHDFLSRINSPSCPEGLIEQLGNAVSIKYDPALHDGLVCHASKYTEIAVKKAQEKIGKAFDAKEPRRCKNFSLNIS